MSICSPHRQNRDSGDHQKLLPWRRTTPIWEPTMERLALRSTSTSDLIAELRQRDLLAEANWRGDQHERRSDASARTERGAVAGGLASAVRRIASLAQRRPATAPESAP
jgi:hypothetical protein